MRLRHTIFPCALLLVFAAPLAATQEFQPRAVTPEEFGIDLPAGEVLPGAGRRVNTVDEAGEGCVALVYVRVGDAAIVMLPDGRLVPRSAAQCTATERPFKAIDMDTLGAQLIAEEFEGFKTKQTRRYLYIYNTSEEYALATSRILETMYPGIKGYMDQQDIETRDPEVPLVVLMFRTEEEFQK